MEPNRILTTEASFQTITRTIFKLHESGFFQYLKPMDKKAFEEIKKIN